VTSIVIVDGGFKIIGVQSTQVRWSDITEISAYKVDAWAYDIICFSVRTHEMAEGIELQEEWDGFKKWIAEVEVRFEIRRDWWPLVAYPAFQENYMVLWPRTPATEPVS